MSAIAHAYAEQTTEQTHTGNTNWTDISGAAIASGQFVTGKKYLLVVCAHVANSHYNQETGFQVLHGSTVFADSESKLEQIGGSYGQTYHTYLWFDVWTAIDSEGIKCQYKTYNSGETVGADHITLFAMNLSDDLTEDTDWHYSINSTSQSLSTTWSSSNNAAVTFTPGTASHDWLVLAMGRIAGDGTSFNQESRLQRSGEASSTAPLVSWEGEDGTELLIQTVFRAFSLGVSSNTFTQQSRFDEAGPTTSRTHSKVFALNLNKFDVHQVAFLEAQIELDNNAYGTEVQGVTIVPDVVSDVWILGQFISDPGLVERYVKGRIQVDNTDDEPPGVTADAYQQANSWDATDEIPVQYQALSEDLSAASHTIDYDASAEESSGQMVEDRQLVAVTMELAAAGPSGEIKSDIVAVVGGNP